jgi:hypothetical protein
MRFREAIELAALASFFEAEIFAARHILSLPRPLGQSTTNDVAILGDAACDAVKFVEPYKFSTLTLMNEKPNKIEVEN